MHAGAGGAANPPDQNVIGCPPVGLAWAAHEVKVTLPRESASVVRPSSRPYPTKPVLRRAVPVIVTVAVWPARSLAPLFIQYPGRLLSGGWA